RAQVLVDAEGPAHPLDRVPGRVPAVRLSAEQHTIGGELGHAHEHGLSVDVHQPMQDPASDAGQAIETAPARQAENPPGLDLEPQLQATRWPLVHSLGLPIRCSSNRYVRLPTTGKRSNG